MGMNKQQKQAAERAKKSAAPEVKLAEPPKPEATAAAPSVPANKQTATFDKLKEAWTAKNGVDLSKIRLQRRTVSTWMLLWLKAGR